ncbi:non-canonical purine NTP diphosphatase [Flavobacterium aquatile]|uniref:dITP/XTP pyrophosphatase n=1 Tax=Flavobacterium aquatile LMG 4008 = ATCC 11947 TaxID=1453498 RepID=A0A095SYA2_9FLAO|nr:non-canonical purine NTP diphosphatase [Flavobacterium aquatile]KGD69661.1 deoxyribonucleotide triphosphate pyrophosphatase [Flavobacterium aquatile LMG 4008 = ATCC 11947]OXA67199.1 non-canonical purine NTP pyrophosphatase [Flavobacterium aquatile LMG 4008 = ATCC 11947]GEC77857.1 non-canonical purine NTP pyrophosphatase [Flavobacterium aquatile]
MKLVFASNNKNKIREIQLLVSSTIEIVSLEDIGCTEEIPETADTIEGNAVLKANYVTEKYGFNCFADDSGLEVDALNGEPGVFSARYAGEPKNDDNNMNKLLSNLKDKTNRKANFKTVICLNLNGEQHLFTGIINGKIIDEKIGDNGFGYDPIFVADKYTKTFAELTIEEKSTISHRGIAVKQLIEFLQ